MTSHGIQNDLSKINEMEDTALKIYAQDSRQPHQAVCTSNNTYHYFLSFSRIMWPLKSQVSIWRDMLPPQKKAQMKGKGVILGDEAKRNVSAKNYQTQHHAIIWHAWYHF